MNILKRLFAFFLALFTASFGQAIITAHQPDSAAQESVKTVSGEVVSVDSDKNEVVIKDNADSEVRLVVNESANLTKGDKTISLEEVKPGEKVTCELAESEGKWVAKSIQVATE